MNFRSLQLSRRLPLANLFPLLFGFVSVLLSIAGTAVAQQAPAWLVDFPAAAGIKPTAQPVGPMQVGPVTSGLTITGNDVVIYDTSYSGTSTRNTTGGAFVNLAVRNNGSGTETVLASSTVGSGPFQASGGGTTFFTIAPSGLIYFFVNGADLVEINPVTGVRTNRSPSTNTGLGPVPKVASCLTWDFATGTILYFDSNTSPSGFFRVDPATGIRTAVSLNGNSVGSGVVVYSPDFMVTDQYGNLFYLDLADATTQPIKNRVVGELPISAAGSQTYGARKVISSGTVGTGGAYSELTGLAIDQSQTVAISNGLPVAESLIVSEAGVDQATSALYRVASDTGNHTKILSYNSTNANTGTAVFDLPASAVPDTTGRIYYLEGHNGSYPFVVNVLPAGTHANAPVTGAQNFSNNLSQIVPVPAVLPTLAAATVSNNTTGSTVTLNGNVTADGGIANSGIISRGFVYAPTSVNAAPKRGGTGVTVVSNFQAGSTPVLQGANLGAFTSAVSGLSQNTSYTFSAYAQDISGFVYTASVAFVTPSLPTVTSPTATAITGVSATLGGNVTSDGGGTLTARGIVYSATATNSNPTIGGTGVVNITDATATTGVFTDGTGNNLANGTAYSYKAYATNAVGTAYTAVGTFTTAARPTANSQSVSTAFNTAKAITLTGSDPNTPAQTLTYAVTSNPTHGTLTGTAPSLTYTPTANYQGTDSFQFTTTNTSGLTSTAATVSITIAAGTPTANSQSVSVQFNTATAITLTGSDPDSPALALTYTIVTAPTRGTLTGTAPNLTYTPTANYQGSDSFTFTVSNGQKTSSTATVSITVAAGTPMANAQAINVNLNRPQTITLTGTDPDSPALALTYTVATQPTNGTLSGTAPNLTYTPNTGYTGSDSFTFTVSNGQKTSATATVSLTVIGQPTISSFTPASGPVGTVVTITGTNLQNASGVNFFRNVAGTNFTVVSSTQVTVRVPTGATSGTLTLLSGSGSNSSSTKFIVTVP